MKRIFLTLVLTLFFVFLSFTSVFAKDKWISVQSAHFTLIGDVSNDTLQNVGFKLEQFRSGFALLFPAMKLDDFTPIKVFVFKSHKSFKPFKPLYEGKPRENLVGYFLTDETANYIALTTDSSGIDLYELIYHEYVHFIVEKNYLNPPVWFSEGLAEVYSTFETVNNGKSFRIGSPVKRHLSNVKRTSIFPYQILFRIDHSSPYFNESDKSNICYSNSWALVHYLILGNEGKRRAQLQTFLERLNSNPFIDNLFKEVFQTDYEQMESEVKEYVKKSLPVIETEFTKSTAVARDFKTVSISEAEVEVLFGDLQAYVGRLSDASERFQTIIKLNPNFSDGYLYLAKLRFYEDRPDEAKPLVEKAVSLNTQNWLAQYYYGNLLREAGDKEGASKAYRQSIKLMPNFSLSHTALALLLYDAERLDEAIAEFEVAIKLNPLNFQNYRNISNAFLKTGRGKLAAENASKFLQLKGWQDENSSYTTLVAYFGYRQSQQKETADNLLKEAMSKLSSTKWSYNIFRYLRNELTTEQLIAKADNNDKLTEAHTYIGMNLSLQKKFNDAVTHLIWVKENGNKKFIEYGFALAELERIRIS